jgi:PAS domain S-box-containing protein
MITLPSIFLNPPLFADAEKTRIARLLYIVIGVLLIGSPLYAVVLYLAGVSDHLAIRLGVFLIFIVLLIPMLFAVQRGYVRSTAIVLVTYLWYSLALIVALDGSVASPMYSWFIVVIVCGGLVISARGLFALVTATIVFGVLIFVAERAGLTATFAPPTPAYYLFFDFSSFILSGGFVTLAFKSMYDAWKQTQDDASSLRRANDDLQQTANLLKQTFEDVSDSVFIKDREGHFLHVNQHGAKLTGKSAEDFINHTDFDLYNVASAQEIRDSDIAVIESQTAITYEQTHIVDNETRIIVIKKSPIFDKDGKVIGLFGVGKDITGLRQEEERKLVEEALRAEVSTQQQALRLKDDFVGMVSHELRTPLSVILSSKDILQRYADRLTPEKVAEHFDKIGRQTHFMTEMIDQLLLRNQFNTQMISFEPGPVDIEEFCQEIYDQMRLTKRENLEINFVHEKLPGIVMLDAKLMRYALNNLLSNAVKYSPEGGEVRLTVVQDDDFLVFTVSDQGIGIPERDQKRLFEPFYRAGNARDIQGTGLGLSIVNDSVEKHGGAIMYESVPGNGSTFTVTIPLSLESQNVPEGLSVEV